MCKKCGVRANYKPSPRIHKRPPRQFRICSNCGATVQCIINTDGSVHEFETAYKKPSDIVLSDVINFRVTEADLMRWKKSGMSKRDVFLRGLK